MKEKLFLMLLAGMFSALQAQLSREQTQELLHLPDILPAIQAEAYRPASNAYYRLDSIVFMDYDAASGNYSNNAKNVFGWNVKRNVSYIPYIWDASSNSYTHNKEYLYSYVNPNSDILAEYLFRLDLGNGIEDYYLLRYQYDSQGRLTDYFGDLYNSTSGQLEPYNNRHFVYTGNNSKPDSLYYYVYDASQSTYVMTMRVSYSFNANGILEQSIMEFWNSSTSSWELSSQITRTFNGNDITSELQQVWDASAGAWLNQTLLTYTYSTTGNQKTIESVWQTWDAASSTWMNYYKEVNVIDLTDNKILSTESYNWDGTNWIGNMKTEYIYSANTVSVENIYWDSNTGNWMSGSTTKKVYNYDINIPGSYIIVPKKYSHPMQFYINLSGNGQTWINPERNPFQYLLNYVSKYTRTDPSLSWELQSTDFYYYNNTLDVQSPNIIEHNLYPNPTGGTLRIHVQTGEFEFRLYDMSGKMIFTGRYSNNEEIRLPGLEKGIYPYKVITSDGVISGKIIHR